MALSALILFLQVVSFCWGDMPPFRDEPLPDKSSCVLFCYYRPNEDAVREARLWPTDLPSPQPCTHLVYAFAGVTPQHTLQSGHDDDLPTLSHPGTFGLINTWRARFPELRMLLAVRPGSRKEQRRSFLREPMDFAANDFTRSAFAKSVVGALRRYFFEGMVLHIRDPADIKWNYIKLVQKLRSLFEEDARDSGKERLTLVVSIPAKTLAACKSFLPAIDKEVDYIYIPMYESESSSNPYKTSFQNPLYPVEGVPLEDTVSHLTSSAVSWGVSKSKLVAGLSLFGRSFVLRDPEFREVGAPALELGYPGALTATRGSLAYFEMCRIGMSGMGRVLEDPKAHAYILIPDFRQWISFTGPGLLFKQELDWIMKEGVAGVGLFSLDADDFLGFCRMGKYPLLRAADRVLGCTEDKTQTTDRLGTSDQPAPTPNSTIV